MSTVEERLSALRAARALLVQFANQPDGTEAARIGRWYLQDYPREATIGRRLSDLRGFELLLAVRRFARVRALLDELMSSQRDARWNDGVSEEEVRRVARHYPQRQELEGALRTPRDARVWSAFYLDRASGRFGVLLAGEPLPDCRQGAARRSALRCLGPTLVSLERDPNFPPLGVSEARQLQVLLPSRAELGCRLAGLGPRRFNEIFLAVERGCQLIEAVVDGTFPASLRQQARAQRISRHLPNSEMFALAFLGDEVRQAWTHWLLGVSGRQR